MGDFFTRFSPFFMDGVRDLYSGQGIILKPVDMTDLLHYHTYYGVADAASGWGMKPGGLALAKACSRMFQQDGKQYLQHWLAYHLERRIEDDYRGLFEKTGLLVAGPNDAASLFEKAADHVSPEIYGEITPTVGRGLEAEADGYDGIIIIGPFNCLPVPHLRGDPETAQHPAGDAHPDLRERRLCGLAVDPPAGGCSHSAGTGARGQTTISKHGRAEFVVSRLFVLRRIFLLHFAATPL